MSFLLKLIHKNFDPDFRLFQGTSKGSLEDLEPLVSLCSFDLIGFKTAKPANLVRRRTKTHGYKGKREMY